MEIFFTLIMSQRHLVLAFRDTSYFYISSHHKYNDIHPLNDHHHHVRIRKKKEKKKLVILYTQYIHVFPRFCFSIFISYAWLKSEQSTGEFSVDWTLSLFSLIFHIPFLSCSIPLHHTNQCYSLEAACYRAHLVRLPLIQRVHSPFTPTQKDKASSANEALKRSSFLPTTVSR